MDCLQAGFAARFLYQGTPPELKTITVYNGSQR